jgi:hypothetical protein
MRWRVFGAVVFAFACSYAILWSFGYARARLGEAIEEIAEQIEVSGQPRFEVARGTRTLEPTEEKRLRIENIAGSVEVVPGGPDTVAEFVIYARGEDKRDARRRAAAVEVRGDYGTEHGDRIWVTVEEGERWPSHVSVDLVVKTPPGRAIAVKGISADVEVMGMQGGLTVHTTSGDVEVTSSIGPVEASSTSGRVRVLDADGRVEVRTVSGDISLENIRGEVASATSTSGDTAIRVARPFSGEIESHSVSGSIVIEVTRPFSGEIESRSSSGSVGVVLPASSDCEVRAKTVSGNISGGPWSEVSRGQARTRLGAGAGSVEISTTSGNIRLNTNG